MNLKKSKNNIHDKSYKDLYSSSEVFLDLVKNMLKAPLDVPTNFKDIIYNNDIFGNTILDFKYDIFDINNNFSKEYLLNSKSMTSAIFLLDQKIDALEFLERIKAIALFFNNLNEKEMQVLKHWIKNSIETPLADEAIKILNSERKDVETMVANNAFILTESLEKAEEKGLEKGLEKGKKEIAIQMIKKGFTTEVIIELTNLSKEEIEELRKSIKH